MYSWIYLVVLGNEPHAKVESHVDKEQSIGEDVKSLPAHSALTVQKSNLYRDPNEVQKCYGHHAHYVVTPEKERRKKKERKKQSSVSTITKQKCKRTIITINDETVVCTIELLGPVI